MDINKLKNIKDKRLQSKEEERNRQEEQRKTVSIYLKDICDNIINKVNELENRIIHEISSLSDDDLQIIVEKAVDSYYIEKDTESETDLSLVFNFNLGTETIHADCDYSYPSCTDIYIKNESSDKIQSTFEVGYDKGKYHLFFINLADFNTQIQPKIDQEVLDALYLTGVYKEMVNYLESNLIGARLINELCGIQDNQIYFNISINTGSFYAKLEKAFVNRLRDFGCTVLYANSDEQHHNFVIVKIKNPVI